MVEKQYSLWIEAEHRGKGELNIEDGTTGVIIEFEDGSRWVASFFTYHYINTLARQNQKSGERPGGYFGSRNLILVDEISRTSISAVIEELLRKNELKDIFTLKPRSVLDGLLAC